MSLSDYKLTDAAIAQKGVVAAPDKLTGTAAQNKAVFDRLIRDAVQELFNGLIDALSSEDGAAEVGTTAIAGVTGGDVQTVLGSLKTLLDTKAAGADMASALALKSDKAVTDLHIKSVGFNAETGVFTFNREDGSHVSVDTVLEKVATNWQYDAATQSLVLTLADGTAQRVPLSAFITETEFADSASIAFSVSNHTVSATVKAGGITDAMLSSALAAQLRGYVSDAADSASDAAQSESAALVHRTQAANSANTAGYSASEASTNALRASNSADAAANSASAASGSAETATQKASDAADSAEDSEAWAVGQRGGTDVDSSDETYHNNAKYWAEQAQHASGGGGVTSFNERTGAVVPQSGDYTADMVSGLRDYVLGVIRMGLNHAICFSADGPFSIGIAWNRKNIKKNWEGTVEWTDGVSDWAAWDGTTALNSGADNKIYMRGTGNTRMIVYQSSMYQGQFEFSAPAADTRIRCKGNIETLLDYKTVAAGGHPAMSEKCFHSMFAAAELLIEGPDLCAETLVDQCYESMFEYSGLIAAPKIAAATLAERCCCGMLQGCMSLRQVTIPAAKIMATSCYEKMYNASGIWFADTDETYQYPFSIPSTADGTDATNALASMFGSKSDPRTPIINTAYYCKYPVV